MHVTSKWIIGALLLAALGAAVAVVAAPEKAPAYRSIYDVAFSPDGKLLAASDHTAGVLAVLETAGKKVQREVELNGRPAGVAWGEGGKVYVAELGAGTVAEVEAAEGKVARRFTVSPRPICVAVAPKAKLLLAGDAGLARITAVDLGSGNVRGQIETVSRVSAIAVAPDESLAIASNLLPVGDATEATQSACLTVVDLKGLKKVKDIKLPSGCAVARDVVISPDGKWAYASHTLGRFTLPTTQLDRGWVNTNAMSVIDLGKQEVYATVLLDRLTEGAADPWGLAISGDGKTLWVTLSGVHQLARIDLESLHLLMDGKDLPKDKPDDPRLPRHLSAIWGDIKKDPARRDMLANDLAALYGAGLLIRTPLENCNGPRGIDLAPDGKCLAVAGYFSGNVLLVDAATDKAAAIAVGNQPKMDSVRRGEMVFHDGTMSFQHWLSCATCHPDGRADGLNWDLQNDGIGNPKNTRSLLLADKTPPSMSRGVRPNFKVASLAGFRYILFREPEPDEVQATEDFIASMQPDRSPYLQGDGQLTEKAKQGKAIFEDAKVGCATCHPGPLLTDLKTHNVGTRGKFDRVDEFDNPTLIELWRTAPYLHDGQAKDLRDVLTTCNKGDKHGHTSHLSKEQIDALIEYLLSL